MKSFFFFPSGFSLLTVYLIGGFLYQRLIVGAKGMEQFPNYAFWVEVGNLAAVRPEQWMNSFLKMGLTFNHSKKNKILLPLFRTAVTLCAALEIVRKSRHTEGFLLKLRRKTQRSEMTTYYQCDLSIWKCGETLHRVTGFAQYK